MICHHPPEIHSSLFFSLLYTPGIWLLWTPSPFWSTFVWVWTTGGTVRPYGTFGPFQNFQQTFGPWPKVPEIWSLPNFPWIYLVHVKWFWTGPNIKDLLVWTKCFMDVLDRTEWSCNYQGHFGMDQVSYEWHVLCIKCLMDILDRPKHLLTVLGDWMVGGKRIGISIFFFPTLSLFPAIILIMSNPLHHYCLLSSFTASAFTKLLKHSFLPLSLW